MGEQAGGQRWEPLREALEADVRRVGSRLRSLSHARLAAPREPYPSAAEAGREAARLLASAAALLEAAADGASLVVRPLPALSDFAVGDQVTVTGGDLLAAVSRVAPATVVADGRTAEQAVRAAAEQLAAIRRLL